MQNLRHKPSFVRGESHSYSSHRPTVNAESKCSELSSPWSTPLVSFPIRFGRLGTMEMEIAIVEINGRGVSHVPVMETDCALRCT